MGVSFDITFKLLLKLLYIKRIVQFFYRKIGEPIAIFCFIGASPAEFISPKSKTTFLYSKLEIKKGEGKRRRVGRLKSLLALSPRSYQNFLKEMALNSPQLLVIVVMCLLKV